MRDLAGDVQRVIGHTMVELARVTPGGEVVERGRVIGSFSGIPQATFNPIHCWEPADGMNRDLPPVVDRADELGLRFEVVVPSGAPHEDEVARLAAEAGLVSARRHAPGMVLDDLDETPALPDGIGCREIVDPAEAGVLVGLALGLGMPDGVAARVYGPEPVAAEAYRWFVLLDGDEPVACSMVSLADDVAGIFAVGVPPAHRGRGLGAAATWEAIRAGREMGAAVAALEASEMGRPVYERMGFRTVVELRSFVRNR